MALITDDLLFWHHKSDDIIKSIPFKPATQLPFINRIKVIAVFQVPVFHQRHQAWRRVPVNTKHHVFQPVAAKIAPGDKLAGCIVMIPRFGINKPVHRRNIRRSKIWRVNLAGYAFKIPTTTTIAIFIKVDCVVMLFGFRIVITV